MYREISGKPEYEIVYLKEFSNQQVQGYLKKALKEKWRDAYDKIKSIYNLEDLSHRPVLLDMMVKTLPRINIKGSSEFNVVHLYEAYTMKWFEREDHRLQITKEGEEELVEGLAYRLWRDGESSIHYSALSDMLSYHLKEKINTTRDLEAADYEVRTASFLVRDEEGQYAFAHKSFQEFFIARKIKKELLNKNSKILDLRRLSMEIIFFLKHSLSTDQEVLDPVGEVLAGEYRQNISENALLIFYNIIKMACLDQRFTLNKGLEEMTDNEVAELRRWLESTLLERMDLREARLSGMALPGMIFKETDFSGAMLSDVMLSKARFEKTCFSRSDLSGNDVSSAQFETVTFEATTAHMVNFSGTGFMKCTWRQGDFSLSNFLDANFKKCLMQEIDFTGAGFLGSNLGMEEAREKKRRNIFFPSGVAAAPSTGFKPQIHLGHGFWVISVALSRDNRFMVSASSDQTVKLWDLESGALIRIFKGHESYVTSVFISGDNRRVVSEDYNNTILIWDMETGNQLETSNKKNCTEEKPIQNKTAPFIASTYDFTPTIDIKENPSGRLLFSVTQLPGNNWITVFNDNTFLPSSQEALQYLFYTDGLARYPAKDLPQLRRKLQITKDKSQTNNKKTNSKQMKK